MLRNASSRAIHGHADAVGVRQTCPSGTYERVVGEGVGDGRGHGVVRAPPAPAETVRVGRLRPLDGPGSGQTDVQRLPSTGRR